MPGEFLWGYNAAANKWVKVAVDANGRLLVDITPGAKTPTRVMNLANLPAGATSAPADCAPIDLRSGPVMVAITMAMTFNALAILGTRIHVLTSYNGTTWDTVDWDTFVVPLTAGALVRLTRSYDPTPAYLLLLVENLDVGQPITGITAWVTTGGA